MRRTHVRASWDEFRYGAGWRTALIAAAVLIGLAAFALAMPNRSLSPEPWAERQKRTQAECVARGGHVVQLLFPERGRGDRVCYGG